MKLDIYILNKTSYLKSEKYNSGKTELEKEYWYKIEYLYKDSKGNIKYNWAHISKEDWERVAANSIILDKPFSSRGYYKNFHYKVDEICEVE